MADQTPYSYPDASPADKLRYLEQQYAEAMQAKSVTTGEHRVERQDLKQLAAEIDRLKTEIRESTRMHRVYSRH